MAQLLPRVFDMRAATTQKKGMQTPAEVKIGQRWSAWVPSRGQWLLTTVVGRSDGHVVLEFDRGYGIVRGHDQQRADETTMLENTSLFRLLGP
jgi:hypothetical protein